MSTVQLAFDTRLERHVAVKLLAEHLAEDHTFVSRFRREALRPRGSSTPTSSRCTTSGSTSATGRHYIVMELVDGPSLRRAAARPRRAGRSTGRCDIIGQSCRGLDHAHRNGVVHRDVKPGNLLRSRDDVVKLADFGIAQATEQSDITQVGSVLGTAAYLAPEQARGEQAGPPADLYALGVVTYQLLAGPAALRGASLTELALQQHPRRPPRSTRQPRRPAGALPRRRPALALDAGGPLRRRRRAMERALRAGAARHDARRPPDGAGAEPDGRDAPLERTEARGR